MKSSKWSSYGLWFYTEDLMTIRMVKYNTEDLMTIRMVKYTQPLHHKDGLYTHMKKKKNPT